MDWNSIIYGLIVIVVFGGIIVVYRETRKKDPNDIWKEDEYDDFNNKREPMD